MRFIHISDLHFGKMLHGVSLLENGDQPDWAEKFLSAAAEKQPDAVVIAGDIYDRGSPSGAAMQLFSRMVTALAKMDIPVLTVAGNHDSGRRLSCFSELLAQKKVYISGEVQREMMRVSLSDAYGPVTFWLMPYVFPAAVAQVLEDDTLRDYDAAVRRLIEAQDIDPAERNVIVAHQNVVSGGVEGVRGGSESAVGGVGQVESDAFALFDYAALGHIHAAYPVGSDRIRYAGSPMCYHFDELRQPKKGPLLVDLGEKGTPPVIERVEIPPLHPMRELRGTYEEVMAQADAAGSGEYVKLILTDRPFTPELSAFFDSLFQSRGSVLMERGSEFRRFTGSAESLDLRDLQTKTVESLFAGYYEARTGNGLSKEDGAFLHCAAELLRNASDDGDAPLADKLLNELMKGENGSCARSL